MSEKQPQEPNQENYNELADRLDESQKVKNGGRGVQTIRHIVGDLRRGDISSAKATARNEFDKIQSYPEIKEIIIGGLFKGDPDHPEAILEKLRAMHKEEGGD